MTDRLVREFIPLNTISHQLYQDVDVIRRSLSLPFNVETEWKEEQAGWESQRWIGGCKEREKKRGT